MISTLPSSTSLTVLSRFTHTADQNHLLHHQRNHHHLKLLRLKLQLEFLHQTVQLSSPLLLELKEKREPQKLSRHHQRNHHHSNLQSTSHQTVLRFHSSSLMKIQMPHQLQSQRHQHLHHRQSLSLHLSLWPKKLQQQLKKLQRQLKSLQQKLQLRNQQQNNSNDDHSHTNVLGSLAPYNAFEFSD